MDQNTPKRKQYSAEFKAKVALEAMSNLRTLAEISSAYGIHPVQITKWKSQLQKNAAELFSDKRKKHLEDKDQLIEELYKQVGQRNVELDWLKKKVGFVTSSKTFAP